MILKSSIFDWKQNRNFIVLVRGIMLPLPKLVYERLQLPEAEMFKMFEL